MHCMASVENPENDQLLSFLLLTQSISRNGREAEYIPGQRLHRGRELELLRVVLFHPWAVGHLAIFFMLEFITIIENICWVLCAKPWVDISFIHSSAAVGEVVTMCKGKALPGSGFTWNHIFAALPVLDYLAFLSSDRFCLKALLQYFLSFQILDAGSDFKELSLEMFFFFLKVHS